MRDRPADTGACCPQAVSGVTQLKLGGEGQTVGVMGLDTVFEQLLAMGRAPDEVSDAELLDMVRAARNYIPSRRRAYRAFRGRQTRSAR